MCASCLAVIALCFSLSAGAVEKRGYIWLGTGGPAGTYYRVGKSLCDLINSRSRPIGAGATMRLHCTIAPSGGSTYNLRQVSIGAFTFALSQSDSQHFSHQGTKPSHVVPFKDLRSVLSLYPEPVQVVVSKNSGIETFADIRGKRVNIGNRGSGTRSLMIAIMEAHDIKVDDLGKATGLTSKEYAEALCDDRIDAFVSVTTFPFAPVNKAITECGARLLNLNSTVEEKLVSKFPFYEVITIPAGAYEGMSREITTIGVIATVVTGRRVDAKAVYEFTRTILENAQELRDRTKVPIFVEPDRMVRDGLSAPLHPGAVRYYIEKGWL
ncbi:MAG: TAXI family TRAP transporter solute-binding subunit [Hyphomicrobiales bacterium]